jgi:phosphoribosylanthranilate isomerase
MKVKICGIKSLEAAQYAAECGADALGFVFADSKRKLATVEAKKIINRLPDHVWKVGVFVNEDVETISKTANSIGLTHIQLHGEEQAYLYKGIGLPLIKAASITTKEDLNEIETLNANYILLDSPPGKYRGGNGACFNWVNAKGANELDYHIILAGGLKPENVAQAIRIVQPFMVDVSSGVETAGEKDFDKIKQFIKNAKQVGEENKR